MNQRFPAPKSACALLLFLIAGAVFIGPSPAQQETPLGNPGEVITAEPTGPPPRPASRVLDQTGALTASERAVLTRDFTASAAAGLSLYFIALNSAEGLTEEDGATELAKLWEDAPLTAVILHVPGRGMSIGFSGSRLSSLQLEEIATLTTSALAAGRARQSMPEQGKAAARRLIEDFTRYRAGESLTGFSGLPPSQGNRNSLHQFILWGGGAAVIFLLALWLLIRRRRTHRPRLFPITAPRSRFSAPHSGGNNIMIGFANEREE